MKISILEFFPIKPNNLSGGPDLKATFCVGGYSIRYHLLIQALRLE
jgi:hypothetical protein